MQSIIPQGKSRQSKALKSGDFGEILTTDIREYLLGECALRGKQNGKATADQPVTGSDIVTCKIQDFDNFSTDDELYVSEVKTTISKSDYSVLEKAAAGSGIDKLRISETLVFLKRRYDLLGYCDLSKAAYRFFKKAEIPCKEYYQGSGITIDSTLNDENIIATLSDVYSVTEMLFVRGQKLKGLVDCLYERALLC